MRIAVNAQSLYKEKISGVGHYAHEVISRLNPQTGVEVTLFSVGRSLLDLSHLTEHPRIQHKHLKLPNKLVNLGSTLGLTRLEHILGFTPDVVWHPDTGFLPRTTAPVVLTVHDLAWHLMPSTYTPKQHLRYRLIRARKTIRNAAMVLTPSTSTQRDVAREFNRSASNTAVIHHGLEHTIFNANRTADDATRRQRLGLPKRYLVSLATLEPRKNHISTIEAFESADLPSNLHLVLAGGPGWKRRALNKKLAHSPLKDRIHLPDYVPSEDRPALLRGAEALVLPSRYEGFGMQLIEAQACGTPVIVSGNSSLLDIAGGIGLGVKASDTTNLGMAFERFFSDSALRATLSAKGIQNAKRFNWNQAAQRTQDVLISVANKKPLIKSDQ